MSASAARFFRLRLLPVLFLCLALAGCGGNSFHFKNLAKSKRNPRELAKAPGQTVESRIETLLGDMTEASAELYGKRGTDAMELTFHPDYKGDRVFALMYGLVGMIKAAYNFEDEFFITTASLDQQKLYNSARNIEIVAWRLIHRQLPGGEPFLLTYGVYKGIPNLSFERIFSKLIAHQDMMARIIADKNNRRINFVVQGMASAVLFPLGI
jgi:hypothetical protein